MPAPNPSTSIEPAVIRQAARWLVHLHSGEAVPEDYAACRQWREARSEHELAWQRAERLGRQFGAVPPALGVPVLTRQAGINRRAALKAVALLGATLPAAWLGYRYAPWQDPAADYRTRIGEHRDIALADGSSISLNTATAVDVRFSENTRLVELQRGEIYVQTAPDAQGLLRPFVIETSQGRLRALGTRFVVRQPDDDSSTTCLSVLEHRVEITLRSGGLRQIVNQGQDVRFTAHAIDTPRSAPPSAAIQESGGRPAWTRGALYADNMRLDAFLAELGRYRPGIVRCEPDAAALRVSGVFQLSDTNQVLAVLRETLPVRVVWRTKYWVTVAARAS